MERTTERKFTFQETLRADENATIDNMYTVIELCKGYAEHKEMPFNLSTANHEEWWRFYSLLSFMYEAGRMQGIRNERDRRKRVRAE